MRKQLGGWSHIIIRVPTVEEAKMAGVMAYADICFTPGHDDDAIVNIPWRLVEGEKRCRFESPRTAVPRHGKKVVLPVFKGAMAQEVSQLCEWAVDFIKQQTGLKHGHTYRVTGKTVEDETQK